MERQRFIGKCVDLMGGIVVIGASLGGLKALRKVLQAFPENFPLPVAIVQHRDKSSGDPLSDFLKDFCHLETREILDKDEILPGRVYVAPADYHVLVEEGWFSLSTDELVQYSRPSIDVLFETAAVTYGARTLGILMTGANRDGTNGLRSIQKHGGVTIAQDPTTAECRVMPESAIDAGVVDHVVPLELIGSFTTELVNLITPWKWQGDSEHG